MPTAHEIARQSILDADTAHRPVTLAHWVAGITRALLPMGAFALLAVSLAHWIRTCGERF